jgi:tripeptide aminopeptidase
MDLAFSVTERFLRYARLDTQSDPASGSFPSSENQLKFGKLLVEELAEIGVNVTQNKFGFVVATIPSNTVKKVPPILFCAHLDTSPDCEASNVNPMVHKNYRGDEIVLPSDPPRVISPKDFPELLDKIGMDIITSDGNTLLGADNKAGVAELIEVARQLVMHPGIRHGKIILLFVPDEEIGRDVLNLDVEELDAAYGYTIDGHTAGSVNNETFCIGTAKLEIHGNPMHTGEGKGLMENAIRIASEVIHHLPRSGRPEFSEGRNGFIHVSALEGKMRYSGITFQLRAFREDELIELAETIRKTATRVLENFPRSTFSFSFEITEKNIFEVLKNYPFITGFAAEAMRRAGLEPNVGPLRGATTGTGLSFKGLPTANLFTGQHANHSRMEWICVQDMQKAVEAILHLCEIWEEKGGSLPDR